MWFQFGSSPNRGNGKPNRTFERPDRRWGLFLEKPVGGDGDSHFPRLGVNEIRQRENHAIDDSADHGDDRQKAEQAGHQRASGGELTIEIMGMAEPDYQHVRPSVARVSGNGIGGGGVRGASTCAAAATEPFDA